MKKKIASSTLIAMLMFAISGCNDSTGGKNDGQEVTRETGEKATVPEDLTFPNKEDEIFSDKDSVTDYEEDKSIRIELDGDTTKNPEAFMKVVRLMKENNFGYGAINHPVDRDPVCGYVGVIKDVCPRCGRHEGEGVDMQKINCYDCCGR